jgi:hypothetical protein
MSDRMIDMIGVAFVALLVLAVVVRVMDGMDCTGPLGEMRC